jgi:uncharacterized membrane protein (DUF106 family)
MKKLINRILRPDADDYFFVFINILFFLSSLPFIVIIALFQRFITDPFEVEKRGEELRYKLQNYIDEVRNEQQKEIEKFRIETQKKYRKETAEFMNKQNKPKVYNAGEVIDIECEILE